MKIIHNHETGELASTWYRKPTDTGLIMNYHALAPKRYKRLVVSGFVHRIYRACSSWALFHDSLEVAKRILEKNQYPPAFYEPIIKQSLDSLVDASSKDSTEKEKEGDRPKKVMLMLQYRGKCSEDYARALHKSNAPCSIVMTLRKLKTVLPSLKPPVERLLKSRVVYKFTCSRCAACYVGKTSRHLQTRYKEHLKESAPMKKHLNECNVESTSDDIIILHQSARSENYLLTLEALYIREYKPTINTKDEYRQRELTIKV